MAGDCTLLKEATALKQASRQGAATAGQCWQCARHVGNCMHPLLRPDWGREGSKVMLWPSMRPALPYHLFISRSDGCCCAFLRAAAEHSLTWAADQQQPQPASGIACRACTIACMPCNCVTQLLLMNRLHHNAIAAGVLG